MASRPRSKIFYSSILNRNLTLVSHQIDHIDPVDYETRIDAFLQCHSAIAPTEQKLTFPAGGFQIHVLVDRLIMYLCITEETTYHYLPFTFLYRVRDTFVEQPSLVSRSYSATEGEFDRDFGPVLVKIMDDFNSGRADKVSQVEAQIQDVKEVMLLNVEKVIERGEQLTDLISKTEELEAGGQEFRRQARMVYVQAKCRNLKVWLIIVAVALIPITVLILYFTGVIHPSDKPPSP